MTLGNSVRPFQVCGSCRRPWPTWERFVVDPAVRLLGLQSVASNPDANLLVFEHSCGSSISILARRLRHLLPEPEPSEPLPKLLAGEQCRKHCLLIEDLEACDAPCRNARDRELILFVQRIKRDGKESARA